MSTPERTEGAALEAGLLRNVQEEKNSLLQDYETQDETTSTQAKATEPAETRKRTNGWKIVTLLVVGLLVGSALTKTTVMHCRRPAPRVVAVVLEKQPATSEMPDKFWEENFQAELEKPVTLYKRQAGTVGESEQQGANGGSAGSNPNTPPVSVTTVTTVTTLTSTVLPGQISSSSSPAPPNTTTPTTSSRPPTSTSTTHSSSTSTTISTPTSKSTSSSTSSSSSSSSTSTSRSTSSSSSSPTSSTTTSHSTSTSIVAPSSVPPPPPPATTSEPARPPSSTTEAAHETITTGDVTTTQPVMQTSVQSLADGGVTTITHTTWVVYIPAKQTAKDSTLQNAAPGKSTNAFVAALIGAAAGLVLL